MRAADPFLQPGDVAAERLLRHIQPPGRPAEMRLLGDGQEVAQQPDLESCAHPPYCVRSLTTPTTVAFGRSKLTVRNRPGDSSTLDGLAWSRWPES